MARYDCFMIYNELDLLEVRLNELSDVVDVFVISEAPWTFQGDVKPLYFEQNKDRFEPWLPRIRHVVADDPTAADPWGREFHQRNSLKRGFGDAGPDDLVMISDVDEIIRSTSVDEVAARHDFCFLQMDMYLYFMNWRARIWRKAYGAPGDYVLGMPDLSAPRMIEAAYLERFGDDPESRILLDAGWHFSWMGGVDNMLEKLGAFSHTEEEVQRWRTASGLENEVRERRFFYDQTPLSEVPITNLPRAVQRDEERLRKAGLLA